MQISAFSNVCIPAADKAAAIDDILKSERNQIMQTNTLTAQRGYLPPKTLLSVQETAIVLGITTDHVSQLIKSGNLRAIVYGGDLAPVLPYFTVERALQTPGFAHSSLNQLPPNAKILTLDQAVHLSEPSLADNIRTKFAHGFVFYALPGPFGAVVRSYLPTVSQAEHTNRQRRAAEYERKRAGRTEVDAAGKWLPALPADHLR